MKEQRRTRVRAWASFSDRVQPVFITLDPARDTPDFIREYAAGFHPMIALRGTDAQTRKVASACEVFYEKVPLPSGKGYTIDHTAFIYLMDRQGRYVAFMPPGTPTREAVGQSDASPLAGARRSVSDGSSLISAGRRRRLACPVP